MSDSNPPRGPAAANDDTPTDPRLLFDPVIRKVKRPDGWTPELQREFIDLVAQCGSPQQAAVEMGKKLSGIQAIYREPGAESFRAAWDHAVAIGRAKAADAERARGFSGRPPGVGQGGVGRGGPGGGGPSGRNWIEPDPQPESEVSEEAKIELLDRLAGKFLRKVIAERQARLGGEIAAADFYLRQITHLEVMFDLMSNEVCASDAWAMLRQVQRGGHTILDIADTPFARFLDERRRKFWAATGEPMRPLAFREEYLEDHGDHRTEPGNAALGQCTDPPPGVDREAWAAMGNEEQKRVLGEVYSQAADDQLSWEEAARREYEERRASDASS